MVRCGVIFVIFLVCSAGCQDASERHAATVASLVRSADYPGLAQLLEHRNDDLRCRAARALTWVKTVKAATQHKRLLSFTDCSWEIRSEAAWRLMEERAPGRLKALQPLLKDPERQVRWNLARVLGTMGDDGALPALDACAGDPDAFVAAWCKWATCKIKGSGGCEEPNMDLRDGKTGP